MLITDPSDQPVAHPEPVAHSCCRFCGSCIQEVKYRTTQGQSKASKRHRMARAGMAGDGRFCRSDGVISSPCRV